ncbi:MAG: PilZ domain-containing protein [Gallionella sp.]|nr:PilZ domain-containing protein [Gallionella sp.]
MDNFTETSVAEASVNQGQFDVLGVFDNVPPVKSSPPQDIKPPPSMKEQRKEARYMVPWRVAISVKGRDSYYGRIKDISLCGAAILNELNLKNGTSITLNIHIPLLDRGREAKILIVHGKTTYSVYDANRLCFRVGVAFVKFEREADRAYLEKHLKNHHVELPDYVCRRSTDQAIVLR